jgi:uncharacterized cupin superfamily protein
MINEAAPVGGSMSIAQSRLVSADVLAAALAPDGPSPLATASAALVRVREHEIGLWEAGPGTDDDVEADEVFLVLRGAGTVTFADGSRVDLRPGVLVHLRAGDRTTWAIAERLRKLYVS